MVKKDPKKVQLPLVILSRHSGSSIVANIATSTKATTKKGAPKERSRLLSVVPEIIAIGPSCLLFV